MAVRFKSKRRCRNCPETKEGLPKKAAPPPATYEGEGRSLWTAALVGCSILFELLFRYVNLGVPGVPLPQMQRLHKRLGEIIAAREQWERPEPVMEERQDLAPAASDEKDSPMKQTPVDYGIKPTEPSVWRD